MGWGFNLCLWDQISGLVFMTDSTKCWDILFEADAWGHKELKAYITKLWGVQDMDAPPKNFDKIPWKGGILKGKGRLPSIYFQVLLLLVSGAKVPFDLWSRSLSKAEDKAIRLAKVSFRNLRFRPLGRTIIVWKKTSQPSCLLKFCVSQQIQIVRLEDIETLKQISWIELIIHDHKTIALQTKYS